MDGRFRHDRVEEGVPSVFRRQPFSRHIALKYHPDVSKESKAEARFKEVSEAYEALGDKEKRVAYDRLLQSGYHQGDDFQPPPDWQTQTGFSDSGFSDEGRVDFSDFFSSIFGGGFKAGSSRRRQNFYGSDNPAAADVYAEITLQLVDAYKGGEKRIAYQSPEVQQNGQVIMKKYTIDVSIPGIGLALQLLDELEQLRAKVKLLEYPLK